MYKLLSISNSKFSRFAFGKCNLSNLSEIFAAGIPISLGLSFSPSLFASRPNFIGTAKTKNSPFISNGKWNGFLFVYACPASCIQQQQQQQQKRTIWPKLQRDPLSIDQSLGPIHFFCICANCNRKHFRSIQLNSKWLGIYIVVRCVVWYYDAWNALRPQQQRQIATEFESYF